MDIQFNEHAIATTSPTNFDRSKVIESKIRIPITVFLNRSFNFISSVFITFIIDKMGNGDNMDHYRPGCGCQSNDD